MSGVALQVVQPDATPEEIAAIVAAVTSLVSQSTIVEMVDEPGVELSAWVRAARCESRRVVPQRGAWRLSGRMPRR